LSDASRGAAYDVAVIGGGLVGSAIAWGLARLGSRVVVLDEGDIALRASRGNFALVWVQNKGNGLPAYGAWTLDSARAWPGFARELLEETGLDVKYQRPGGFHMVLSEREYEVREAALKRLHAQPGMPHYDWEMMDHARVASFLPDIGPEVVGASYSAWDGHCNSLRLLRALNMAMQKRGVAYHSNHPVSEARYETGEFRLFTPRGEVRATKLALRAHRHLEYPVSTIRQTDEGGVMIGDSQEEKTEPVVGHKVIAVLADRARRMFPKLASLNIVRTWAALRVMTQDGFPIYEESGDCPGAFVATCHSGVTLAAGHALTLAPLIARGELPAERFQPFSTRRFHVQKAA